MEIDWESVVAEGGPLMSHAASLLVLVLALLFGWAGYRVLYRLLKRLPQDADGPASILVRHSRGSLRLSLPLLTLMLVAPGLQLPPPITGLVRHMTAIGLILTLAWLLTSAVRVLRDVIFLRYDMHGKDNLRARVVHTQVNVVAKILMAIIAVFALASVLMTFDKVRQVGVGLLASAGMAGIIAGFAAQHSLSTLFAGLQLALTQPIRIDDVVIVEGEWGRVEEITLTYVVVCIWDQRRLVVPVSWFLQKTFQNWTRTSAEILGTVSLYADFGVDVEAMRAELQRLLQASPLWDGRAWGLQVTNVSDRCVELRALMSAVDAGAAWDLRCAIREQLLTWLQKQHPEHLPRLRAQLEPETRLTPRPAES